MAIRFISAEPLLGPLTGLTLDGVSWVITGGESGGPPERALIETTPRGVRPKPEGLRWVREIRDLCRAEGVAFFHKQWGGRTPKAGGRRLDRRAWSEYPEGGGGRRSYEDRGDSLSWVRPPPFRPSMPPR